MVNTTKSDLNQDQLTKIFPQFSFFTKKTSGKSEGFIAKKVRQEKVKPEDNKSGKKYDYTWMIKAQDPVENIASILSSGLAGIFFGDDCAPKERLLDTNNCSGEYIRSRFLENFQSLTKDFELNEYDIDKTFTDFFQNTANALKVKAFNLLIANYDDNIGNLGRVFEEVTCKAGIIDLGQSLFFCEPSLDDSIRRQINVNYTRTGFKLAIIQEDFIDALDDIIESFDDVVMSHIIKSTLEKKFTFLIEYNSNLVEEFFATRITNLQYKNNPSYLSVIIFSALKARCEALKNLSDVLKIEWAIINNELDKIKPILEKNKDMIKRKTYFFPILGKDATIADYVLKEEKPKVIENKKKSIKKLF